MVEDLILPPPWTNSNRASTNTYNFIKGFTQLWYAILTYYKLSSEKFDYNVYFYLEREIKL